MLLFKVSNPFPLLAEGVISYSEEKRHAETVDQWLGFKVSAIENQLRAQVPRDLWAETWVGLPQESLQTPYIEIRRVLELVEIKPGTTVSDIGCAYGRMAHVLAKAYPEARFIGIESVESRIQEARRVSDIHKLGQSQWTAADFKDSAFLLPEADIFFVYDSSTTQALQNLLQKLRARAQTTPITVVGRGRRIRDLIEREEPWLSQVLPPKHYKNFSIYQSYR